MFFIAALKLVSKVLLAALVVSACGSLRAQANVWQPVLGHTQVPIWPEAIPDANEQPLSGPEYYTNVTSPGGVRWNAVCNVSIPTLTVYSPKNKSTDVAVVVFPGGGYNCLAIDVEGVEIMAVGCSGNFPLSTCPGSLIIRE